MGNEGLYYIFFGQVRQFWQEVQRITQTFTEYQIPDDPTFFCYSDRKFQLKDRNSVLCHLGNAAKSCIPMCWKDPKVPLISKVRSVGIMENLFPKISDRKE